MTEDLDTLLTALYVEIDDHVAPPRQGRGRRPRLTDAELCVWPWPRCCSGSTASTAGSGSPTAGWATCSATCPTSPATTSGCGPPHRCWPRRSATWPGSARGGATACG